MLTAAYVGLRESLRRYKTVLNFQNFYFGKYSTLRILRNLNNFSILTLQHRVN
jgi:hypothetical protein